MKEIRENKGRKDRLNTKTGIRIKREEEVHLYPENFL